MNVTFHYQFSGGLTNGTVARVRSQLSNLFGSVSDTLGLVSECAGVNITTEEFETSPPGESSVFFQIPVVFTASNSIADGQVSTKLTSCIDTSKSYKGTLDANAPTITQEGLSQRPSKPSTITDKKSCCSGNIPPPCCAAGAVNVSSTKCGNVSIWKNYRYVAITVFTTNRERKTVKGTLIVCFSAQSVHIKRLKTFLRS